MCRRLSFPPVRRGVRYVSIRTCGYGASFSLSIYIYIDRYMDGGSWLSAEWLLRFAQKLHNYITSYGVAVPPSMVYGLPVIGSEVIVPSRFVDADFVVVIVGAPVIYIYIWRITVFYAKNWAFHCLCSGRW
eukprot:gene1441-837_t